MPSSRLTERQLTMIQLMVDGRTYDAIAAELGVTRDTVAHQLAAARHAWGAINNAQLTGMLFGAGLLPASAMTPPEPGPEHEPESDGDGPGLGRTGGLVLIGAVVDAAELCALVPVTILLELF